MISNGPGYSPKAQLRYSSHHLSSWTKTRRVRINLERIERSIFYQKRKNTINKNMHLRLESIGSSKISKVCLMLDDFGIGLMLSDVFCCFIPSFFSCLFFFLDAFPVALRLGVLGWTSFLQIEIRERLIQLEVIGWLAWRCQGSQLRSQKSWRRWRSSHARCVVRWVLGWSKCWQRALQPANRYLIITLPPPKEGRLPFCVSGLLASFPLFATLTPLRRPGFPKWKRLAMAEPNRFRQVRSLGLGLGKCRLVCGKNQMQLKCSSDCSENKMVVV